MATTDLRERSIPDDTDPADGPAALAALSRQVRDVQVVSGTSERAQYRSDMLAAGLSGPFFVYRQDTGDVEANDGASTAWTVLAGPSLRPTISFQGGVLAGSTYPAGRTIHTKYVNGALTPDANGDTIVLPNPEFAGGGGILTYSFAPTSLHNIDIQCRMLTGNLVARAIRRADGSTVTDAYACTGRIDYFKAA